MTIDTFIRQERVELNTASMEEMFSSLSVHAFKLGWDAALRKFESTVEAMPDTMAYEKSLLLATVQIFRNNTTPDPKFFFHLGAPEGIQ